MATLTRSVRFVEANSSLGGRRFEPVAELSLHHLVETVAATMPGPPGEVLLIPEMPSPLGLPDFVAVVGGAGWAKARMASGVAPILSEVDCTVLAVLGTTRSLSLASIARRLGWAVVEVEPVVQRLSRSGAIQVSSGGAVVVNPALKPVGSVIAIEAKIKDWQRAVLQGRSYRTWANNYVVVLGDVGPVAEERARLGVQNDGGGLFIRSGWAVRPRARRPTASKRIQGFEHLFAALASGPTF